MISTLMPSSHSWEGRSFTLLLASRCDSLNDCLQLYGARVVYQLPFLSTLSLCFFPKIMWGNVAPYVTSYLVQFDDTVTYHKTLHVYTAVFLGQSLFMYLGGQLEKKIGPRTTAYVGAILISSGTYLSSYCKSLHILVMCQVSLSNMSIALCTQSQYC